ncbi:MAG: WD40 repeat domain-containing protein [Thiohalocapsa sp.]|uniref:nSTAND1 domain-containing NTPase n=1 Tax=Thiohalocapsa sp. TaxID=2497641 RepID=UPI0025CBC073|nr:AAA family ATPase [Thiohalocapsa sp.]MCG6941980.1 WD40 repeat domain-containing protein [Thiohalocapsa sp.]
MNQRARDARIKIFVSSPSDVEHERAAVKDIIERLGREYLPYFQLQAVLWEEEALTADRTFQAGLTQPEDCDIVLVILWTRLGSPLPEEPYRGMTGTEWEFVNAVEASARAGTPEVLVYKKTAPKLVDITDAATAREAVEDRRRLDEFFRTHFFNEDNTFRRAFRVFDGDAAFRELVETQLRKLLNRRISAERRASAGIAQWQGSPFRADRPFDIGDERVFTGREQETRALLQRLEQRPPGSAGLLLLSGPSGSGKTSLLRAGLVPRLTRPFLFEHIATVRCALVDPGSDGPSPLAALAARLHAPDVLGVPLAELGLSAGALERLLASEPELAAGQLASALAQLAKGNDAEAQARLAVIVDPLDPALAAEAAARDALLKALRGLSGHPAIWVIAALRSNALRHLTPLAERLLDPARSTAEQVLALEPPPTARIRQVIEIPARVAGIELDAGAVGEGRSLVERLESEAVALRDWAPPVQALLQAAYEHAAAVQSGEVRLTAEHLRAAGGLTGIVLARADALWARLDADARAALPRLCRALIAVDGARGAQPDARQGDLDVLRAEPGCRRLIDAMVDARLVVTEGSEDPALLSRCGAPDLRLATLLRGVWRQGREEWPLRRLRRRKGGADALADAATADLQHADTAEQDAGEDASASAQPQAHWQALRAVASFAHPALLTDWAPVGDWLAAPGNRRTLALRTQLSRQARLWKRTDCNREYLYGETVFAAADTFARTHPDELEPLEREFLAAAAANLAFLRRRNRLVRVTGLVLVSLLLGAVLAAGFAWEASRTARVNLNKSLLKEAELHIARGNTPQAIINAIDAGADLPEQAVRKLGLAFAGNRLLAMAPSAGPNPDDVRIPAIAADGEQLATVTPDQGPVLWRLDRGRYLPDRDLGGDGLRIHSLVIGDEDQIVGIGRDGVWRLPAAADATPLYVCGTRAGSAFTLSPNRRRLAIAVADAHGNDGICVLDLALPGKVLLHRMLGEGEIRGLAFAPDGDRLITASAAGRSHVFDVAAGRRLLSLPADGPLGRPFNAAVFDAAGERIAIAAADERVRLFRGDDGTPLGELSKSRIGGSVVKVHRTAVRDVAFAPRGDFLVAVDDEGQVVRWSLDGSHQAVVLGSHELSVSDVEIAPKPAPQLEGQYLVLTGSLDGTARLWSLETGKPVAVLGHDGAVTAVRFDDDGQRLATFSSRDGTVRLWSVDPVTRLGFELRHSDHVWDVAMAAAPQALAPNGGALLLATAGFDGGVRVWRYQRTLERPAPESLRLLSGHTARVRQVSFSASGRRLASAAYDGTAQVDDLVTERSCQLKVADAADGQVYNALFGPDETWLLTTSNDPVQPVRLFSVPQCAALAETPNLAHGKAPVEAAELLVVGDRTLVATGDDAGQFRLFLRDADGVWHKGCELAPQVGAIGDIALDAEGRLAAVAGAAASAALLDLDPETGGCAVRRRLIGHVGRVYSVAIAPDGQQVLTGSLDKTARVWSRDGVPLAILEGHQDRIYRAVYSPDGRWMLTASRDGSIRLWRTPAVRLGEDGAPVVQEEFLPLQASLGGVAAAVFSPDGHYVAGAYWENAAMLWRIWRDGGEPSQALRRRWGEDRARLALIREAYRFRADNAIVDDAAVQRAETAP